MVGIDGARHAKVPVHCTRTKVETYRCITASKIRAWPLDSYATRLIHTSFYSSMPIVSCIQWNSVFGRHSTKLLRTLSPSWNYSFEKCCEWLDNDTPCKNWAPSEIRMWPIEKLTVAFSHTKSCSDRSPWSNDYTHTWTVSHSCSSVLKILPRKAIARQTKLSPSKIRVWSFEKVIHMHIILPYNVMSW